MYVVQILDFIAQAKGSDCKLVSSVSLRALDECPLKSCEVALCLMGVIQTD